MACCLAHPAPVRAQLTAEEYKIFDKFLSEPDGKEAIEKRLGLVGAALERWGDPKRMPSSSYGVNLKRARIPAATGVPFLLGWVDHRAELTKRTAMHMLADYGAEARPAVPRLRQLMDHSIRGVREDAMLTLARIDPGNKEIAEAIVERLGAKGSDDSENRAAIRALILMATVVPKSAVPKIAAFRDHRWTEVCMYANEAAGKVLDVPRPSLEKLREMETIDWRSMPDHGYSILTAIRDAGPKADFAVPLLVELLISNPPAYLQCAVLDTVSKVNAGNPRLIAAVLETLLSSDPVLAERARQAITYMDLSRPEAVRAMARGLRHSDSRVRFQAAVNLRSWVQRAEPAPTALADVYPPLLATLQEVNDNVPPGQLDVYIELLRGFGPDAEPAADVLWKIFTSETYFRKHQPNVGLTPLPGRLLAVLSDIGVPPAAQPRLLEEVKKGPAPPPDSGYTYAAACRALATFGAKARDAVPWMLPALKVQGQESQFFFLEWSPQKRSSTTTTARLEVVRALGKIGPDAREALPLLKEIAGGKGGAKGSIEATVQQEARRAIEAIEGKPASTPKEKT
jgi:HEAT repeat protein